MSFNNQVQLQVPTPTPPVEEEKATRTTAVAVSTKVFTEKATQIKRGLRAYTTLIKLFCMSSNKGEPVNVNVNGKATNLGFANFRSYTSFYCNRISDLVTDFRASAGRRVKTTKSVRNPSLEKLHYIKDHMTSYIRQVNKGNGLAAYMHGPGYDGDPNLQNVFRLNGSDPTQQAQIFAYIRERESAIVQTNLSEEQAMQNLASRDSGESMSGAQLKGVVDLNTSLQPFFESGIASSKLLNAITHLVINANNLQSKSEKVRIHTDELFMGHFAQALDSSAGFDTNYTVGGTAVAQYEAAYAQFRSTAGQENQIAFVESVTGNRFGRPNEEGKVNRTTSNTLFEVFNDYGKSLLEAISNRASKSETRNFVPQAETPPNTDAYGITYDMIMVFTSRNIVPDYFLSPEQTQALAAFNDRYRKDSSGLCSYISTTHKAHKALKETK